MPSLLYSLLLISNLLFPVLKGDIYYQPPSTSPVDSESKATYGVSKTRTPVFNSPLALRKLSGKNYLNQNFLFTAVEFAAFPGTVFKLGKITKIDQVKMLQVETSEYACNNNCYLPLEFLQLYSTKPPERAVPLFPPDKILAKLQTIIKTSARYCWGCNFPEGIPRLVELLKLSPEKSELDHHRLQKGVDCSGLLYYATNGFTPRNTSQLIEFGRSLSISNLSVRQIKAMLKPLDLILWKGHVIIVLDQKHPVRKRQQNIRKTDSKSYSIFIKKKIKTDNALKKTR
ncbi:MAG: hypothetical protein ACQES9_08760 [Myxococcota bacterium]